MGFLNENKRMYYVMKTFEKKKSNAMQQFHFAFLFSLGFVSSDNFRFETFQANI